MHMIVVTAATDRLGGCEAHLGASAGQDYNQEAAKALYGCAVLFNVSRPGCGIWGLLCAKLSTRPWLLQQRGDAAQHVASRAATAFLRCIVPVTAT